MDFRPCIAALAWAALTSPALAARPLVTDDARIVDPKSCQLESWLQFHAGGAERWAVPACNPTGHIEWALGGMAERQDNGRVGIGTVQFQAKTLIKPLEPDGYGVAFTLGAQHRPHVPDNHILGNVYANLPVSFSFAGDRFVVHVNVGARRDLDAGQTRASWGVGTETRLAPRATLIAETYGENRGRQNFQAGLRFWLVPDRVQIDTTYGNAFGRVEGSRFFSIGLRLLSPAFLP